MTTWFHTDADLVGAATFNEPEVALATRFNVPDGDYVFRWRSGSSVPSNTPQIRIWNEASGLVAGPLDFTAAIAANTWHETTAVTLASGTYRVAVNTTHYLARTGFYAAGSIIRDGITGISGMFGASPSSAPGTSSTATYFVDIGVPDDPEPEPEPEPDPELAVDEPRVGEAMHLARVMDEVALVMGSLTGLTRFHTHPPATITAPAGYVSYPAQILYDQAYARGEDDFVDLPIVVLVGKPHEKRARDRAAAWSSSDGPHSLKARAERWQWTSCDDLTITTGEFDVETIAGVPYLALILKATVVGPGKD